MKTPQLLLFILLGATLSLTGCSGDKSGNQQENNNKVKASAATTTAVAPAAASGDLQPVSYTSKPDPALVEKGRKLFNQNCVFCHQKDAIGKPGVAPSLTNPEFLELASDKFIKGTIRDGRAGTGMPPFAHLGRSGIEAIVAFLRSHTDRPNISAQVDSEPKTSGDPKLGKIWFEEICATCHGENGDGYERGGTGTAIGKAGFLDKASDGFIRETIKRGRSNTRMRGFQGADGLANLTDREIDDIIAYLRTVPSK